MACIQRVHCTHTQTNTHNTRNTNEHTHTHTHTRELTTTSPHMPACLQCMHACMACMHKPHLSVDVGVVGVVVVEMVEVGDNRLANGGVIGFRVGAGGPRIPGGGGCGGRRAGPVGEEDMTNYGYNLQYCGIPTQIGKPIFIPISPKKAHFSAKNGYISFLPILYLDFGTISHHQGHKICRFTPKIWSSFFFRQEKSATKERPKARP